MIRLHLSGELGQAGARPELAGLGLALDLAGIGEVGAVARMPGRLATTRGLPTPQVLLHDAPAAHIPQGLQLLQDRRPLPFQRLGGVGHRNPLS